MSSAIKTINISKSFHSSQGSTQVLHDINLQVQYGEITMLVGPSGCGKTTLLSIMTGILTPSSGHILISDIDIIKLSNEEKAIFRRNKIGFVFQQFNLLSSLTAAENAAVPLVASGMPLEKATEEAKILFNKLGMLEHSNKLPRELSGGQQQRVAFARALIHKPQIMVCDEPTASLDETSGRQVMEILRQIAVRKDSAVVIVTHDNRIFEFADRIFYMNDGKIQKEEKKN